MKKPSKMNDPIDEQVVNVRIKLSAWWTGVMFLYIYGDYFELYTPGKVQDLLDGQGILDSPSKLLLAAILLALPPLMIPFSLILSRPSCRWLNMIIGVLFTGITFLVGLSSLSLWHSFYAFYAFLEAIVTAFIVWTAWSWK